MAEERSCDNCGVNVNLGCVLLISVKKSHSLDYLMVCPHWQPREK